MLASAQGDRIKLSFDDATAVEVVRKLQEYAGVQFNYSSNTLPIERITADLMGDIPEIIRQLEAILGRQIIDVGDGVFAISAKRPESSGGIGPLKIHLYDNKNQEPIIGATVWLPSRSMGEISDAEGIVNLPVIVSDSDEILIKYLGYQTMTTTVGALRNKVSIGLFEKEHVLDDIVIKTYRQVTTTRLTADNIDPEAIDLPGAADQDAFTQAQMIPGVYNSSESLQDLQIRGGPPDQVSYNWNNLRLVQNSLFYGRVSSVNPLMVDQISVTRNGASADEDASASGAINLNTDLASVDNTSSTAHVNGLYANLGVQSRLHKRLSIKAAARRSLARVFQSSIYDKYFNNSFQYGKVPDVDYYLTLFGIDEDVVLEPDFQFGDVSASAEINLGHDSYLRLNAISFGNSFTYKQIKNYTNAVPLDSFTTETVGYSAEWHQSYSDHLSTTVNVGSSDYDYMYITSDDRAMIETDYQTQDNHVRQRDLRVKSDYQRDQYGLTVGYDIYGWDVVYDATSSRAWERWLIAREDASAQEHSMYANVQLHTHPWYRIMAGVRRSSYSLAIFGRNIVEPRLHASIFATDHLTFHAHYGRFHQNLNRRKLATPLQVDNGFWLLSNEGVTSTNYIPIVQSEQYSIGAKYQVGGLSVQADMYRKNGNDIWTSSFDFASEDPYEFTILNITGLELGMQYQNRSYTVMATYDYVRDRIFTQNSELNLNSPFTQPHRLSIYQGIKHGPWSLSSQLILASGRFYSTSTEVGTYVKDGDIVYEARYDSYFDQQVPNYFKVDLGLGYRWQWGQSEHRTADFKVQLLNVLNRQNIIKREYFVDYRTEIPSLNSYDRLGLPFIFNFSVEFTI